MEIKKSRCKCLNCNRRRDGGSNWAELDVRELHGGIGLICLHIVRRARLDAARATVRAWLLAVSGVGAVQPKHVGIVVIPQRHDENHASINGVLYGLQSALLQKVSAILSDRNPVCAEVVSDGIVALSVDCVRWVLNGPALLLVD